MLKPPEHWTTENPPFRNVLGKSTARQTLLEEFRNYMRNNFIGKRWQHPRFARFLQTLFLVKQVSWLLSKTQSSNIWGLDFFSFNFSECFPFSLFFGNNMGKKMKHLWGKKEKGKKCGGKSGEEMKDFQGKANLYFAAPLCTTGCRQGMGRELWPLAQRQWWAELKHMEPVMMEELGPHFISV